MDRTLVSANGLFSFLCRKSDGKVCLATMEVGLEFSTLIVTSNHIP